MTRYLIPVLFFINPTLALAVDWDGCSSDLERLKKISGEASDVAASASSASDDLASAREEHRYCRGSQGMFDLPGSDCSMERHSYEFALDDYEQALRVAESTLTSLAKARKAADWSCGLSDTPAGAALTDDDLVQKINAAGDAILDEAERMKVQRAELYKKILGEEYYLENKATLK